MVVQITEVEKIQGQQAEKKKTLNPLGRIAQKCAHVLYDQGADIGSQEGQTRFQRQRSARASPDRGAPARRAGPLPGFDEPGIADTLD